MKKIYLGLICGTVAGIIDVIPMLIQKLSWDANLSAFTFWVVVGLVVATININLKGALKGVIIAVVLLIPLAIIIGWQEPLSLLPILAMTLILGMLIGWVVDMWGK